VVNRIPFCFHRPKPSDEAASKATLRRIFDLPRWLKFCLSLLAIGMVWVGSGRVGSSSTGPKSPGAEKTQGRAAAAEPPSSPSGYSLLPEQRAKAIAYSKACYVIYFVNAACSLAFWFLLWRSRLAVVFRIWAQKVASHSFFQCLIFVPLLALAVSLVQLPLDYYSGFVLEHSFNLSTQGFASWLSDWGKSFAVTLILGILLIWILYGMIRRSARRWWLYFWLAAIPLSSMVIFLEPLVVDPLFFKFTPLEKTHPELTTRIEQMLYHAGLEIPPSRIFEMNASQKTRTLNAYVTGFGPSKRLVVWDTTIKRLNPDETLLVLGHETGHYVLHHIPKQFAIIELVVFGLLFLGFVLAERMVEHWGRPTGVEGVGDLASLPILMGLAVALQFLASPVVCAISRHYEHQADVYGLEVAYGVVHDPNAAEVRSLQVLGEEDLADPDPNPSIKFWLYTHPPLDERIRFAAGYRPWAEGKPLRFVRSAKR